MINRTPEKLRTLTQNKSIHKYFELVSSALKGYSVSVIIEKLSSQGIELFITPHVVKEIWRTIQLQQVGKKSTTRLTTNEIDIVYDVFNKFISENFEVTIPFPSKNDPRNN